MLPSHWGSVAQDIGGMDMLSKRIVAVAIILFAAAPFVAAVSAGVRRGPSRKSSPNVTPSSSRWGHTDEVGSMSNPTAARAAGSGLGSVLTSTTSHVIGDVIVFGGATMWVSGRPGTPPSPPVVNRPPSPATRSR
jgi:hypothetical protein